MQNKIWYRTHFTMFIILCFLFISSSFSQNNNFSNLNYSLLKYNKNDGYIIDELNSMQFDDEGWLWLSGISYESRNFKLGSNNEIILRFNGQTFYKVIIPKEILNGASNLTMQKSFDNSFYIKIEAKENSKLFKLDAKSLVFSEIKLPITHHNYTPKYELLKLKKRFLLVQQNQKGNKLFYLNSRDEFTLAGNMTTNVNIVGSHFVEFDDSLIISKFNFGSEIFIKKGEVLINSEFKSNGSFSKKTIIETTFYKDSIAYMIFRDNPIIYKYDPKSKNIIPTELFKKNNNFAEHVMHQDDKGHSLFKQSEGTLSQIRIFSDLYDNPIWDYKFNQENTNRSVFASRDLSKEVVFDNYNELEIFIFNSDIVSTFLEDLSIRSMTQIEDNIVLIATDFNGWFLLNLKKKNIEPYWPLENKNKITPQLNRNINVQNNVIWSNDARDLICVDINSRKSKKFPVFNNLSAMTQNREKIILADVENNVKIFNKKSLKFATLIEKDTLTYENLILKDSALYMLTNKGLKYINNQKTRFFTPSENSNDNYLVSFVEYNDTKLLLGSRSGKLFEFNTVSNTFKTIYKDKLSASIASILVDEKKRIWLNTFAGVVVFNPKNKETIRFGINDGLSHYEANRFSALKLNNGHFLIGTVKGVNYFQPDSLISSYNKEKFNHKLQFISIEMFNSKEKVTQTILNRDQLDSIKTITLPAENKNLVVNFGSLKQQYNITYNCRYKLNNSNWVEVTDKHEIRLLNLNSGKYNLEIQALDKTKNKVLSSLSLGLNVEQFFYESIWFYFSVLISSIAIILIYTNKSKQASKANFKNKLLHKEIEYKKKDLADFATNISRNQQWNDYLIEKMDEIKAAKGRKKGAALVNLEKDIKENSKVVENNFEFQKRIDILSNEFYNSLLKKFPKLSKTEIKICSLIRLDLDNYDIATLQNVDVSSIYKSRYRLRKKLNLTSDIDLDAFLKAF